MHSKIIEDEAYEQVNDIDKKIFDLLDKYKDQTLLFLRLEPLKNNTYAIVGKTIGKRDNLTILFQAIIEQNNYLKTIVLEALLTSLQDKNEPLNAGINQVLKQYVNDFC